jgi:hypothetical protein
MAVGDKLAHHDLGVDKVFGTAKTYKADFQVDFFTIRGAGDGRTSIRAAVFRIAGDRPDSAGFGDMGFGDTDFLLTVHGYSQHAGSVRPVRDSFLVGVDKRDLCSRLQPPS